MKDQIKFWSFDNLEWRDLYINFYKEIKNQLVNNKIYKRVKEYSKNRNDLITYYNVGRLLSDASNIMVKV